MYKYFEELDHLNHFITYLDKKRYNCKRDVYLGDAFLSEEFWKKYKTLFERMADIDKLVIAHHESLIYNSLSFKNISYEEGDLLNDFFQFRADYYNEFVDYRSNINLSSADLKRMLVDYGLYCEKLIKIYPKISANILEMLDLIHDAVEELENKSLIKVPSLDRAEKFIWPNSWYITPSGYLYNSGVDHQEGNLAYPFRFLCSCLKNKTMIPNKNNFEHIQKILECGYVTYGEYQNYAHLDYDLPILVTKEVERITVGKTRTLYLGNEKVKRLSSNYSMKSYQNSLITLVVGHLAAETSLFQSFARLNKAKDKLEVITKLCDMTNNELEDIDNLVLDLRDILVRYSGFHKIESVVDHTITTSSLNGIFEFKDYLDKGWNLHIIPGIVYDKTLDQLTEVDFHSYFVQKHFDQQLNQYTGKGKVLIKAKDCFLD